MAPPAHPVAGEAGPRSFARSFLMNSAYSTTTMDYGFTNVKDSGTRVGMSDREDWRAETSHLRKDDEVKRELACTLPLPQVLLSKLERTGGLSGRAGTVEGRPKLESEPGWGMSTYTCQ